MKRELERSEEATGFFHLDECVEILLGAVPSPVFLAQLIQLCKRTRRQAWNFMSDPTKWCAKHWLGPFCRDLYHYRERRNREPFGARVMYPIFIETKNGYALCRVMEKDKVLWASLFKYTEKTEEPLVGLEEGFPGWLVCQTGSINNCFNWYFVARALVLGWETCVVEYSRHCWHKEIIPPDDVNLCLL